MPDELAVRRGLVSTPEALTMSSKPIESLSVGELGTSHAEQSFDWRDFRPEMLPDQGIFAVELTTYRDHLDALLADAGKYVVIKGRDIIGIHVDFEEAVESAFQFVPEPVLVKRIVEKEPTHVVGHGLS